MPKPGSSDALEKAVAALREASDPLAAVAAAHVLRELAERAEIEHIQSARSAGVAWAKIGKQYGLTKQGAQQRFKSRIPETPA